MKSYPSTVKESLVAHACNPNTWKTEAGGLLWVSQEPELQRPFLYSFLCESLRTSPDTSSLSPYPHHNDVFRLPLLTMRTIMSFCPRNLILNSQNFQLKQNPKGNLFEVSRVREVEFIASMSLYKWIILNNRFQYSCRSFTVLSKVIFPKSLLHPKLPIVKLVFNLI